VSKVTRFAWPIPLLNDELGYTHDGLPSAASSNTDFAYGSNFAHIEIAVQSEEVTPASDVNLTGTVTDGGGTAPGAFINPSRANDDDDATSTTHAAFAAGAGTYTWILHSDLGSASSISVAVVHGSVLGGDPSWTLQHSSDNVNWVSPAVTYSWNGVTDRATITLNTPISRRYWRLFKTATGSGFFPAVVVWTWSLTGSSSTLSAKEWEPAPNVNDGVDASYNASVSSNAILRVYLDSSQNIGTAFMRFAAASNGSPTYSIAGTNDPLFTTTTPLASVSVTEVGAFTQQTTSMSWQPAQPYQYYEVSVTTAAARRFHTLSLYEYGAVSSVASNALALGDVVVQNSASSNTHYVAVSSNAGYWYPHHESVLTTGGGVERVASLGNLGTTETIDLANGNYHAGTLNANCTITSTGFTGAKLCSWVVELLEDGTGGWTPTFSGVTWIGGDAPAHDTTASSRTVYGFWTRDGGATIFGFQVGDGSGGSVGALDDLSDVTITTPASGDEIRYRDGVWVNEAGLTAAELATMGVRGEILISDTPSNPIVYADMVLNDDNTDFLYADLVEP
jgi:hypothetical protein